MSLFPVLNIKQFDFIENKGDFYANIFSTHLRTNHASITKPHKHDFYLVVLFLNGSGTHEVDFSAYPIQRGSLFLLRPGQTHHWELSDDIEGYIFFHSREFYKLLFPNKNIDNYPAFYSSQNSPFIQLEEEQIPYYAEQFKNILSEYMDNQRMKYDRLGLLIDLLYLDVARIYWSRDELQTQRNNKNFIWLRKLEDLINVHYLEKKKPSDYADLLNISTKHLNKIVQHTIGKTTSDLIHDRVLLEAKRLLTHEMANVQEISFELGYEDPSYFSRLFKKKCGISPKDFSSKYNAH